MTRRQDKGPYEYRVSGRTEYLTPKWIIDALGPFYLDPCAADPRPFDCAKVNYTGEHRGGADGLRTPWKGLVWLNPPYGISNGMNKFIERLVEHKHGGIALLNSNTQTRVWQEIIFPNCSAVLFLNSRISFLNTDGTETAGKTGSPCLVAFGPEAAKRLYRIIDKGHIMVNINGS